MLQPSLAINAATTREQWGLLDAIDGYARAGMRAIAPWRDQVAAAGIAATSRRLRDSGLGITSLCRGGMFPAADAVGRAAAIADNHRAIDEAAAIGAPVLVLVCGGLPSGSRDLAGARAMVADGIAAIMPRARAAGISLAIEPLHPVYAAERNCINTLDQALDICESLDPAGNEGLGVIFDVYHLWWDPRLAEATARAQGRITGFHISDWLAPTVDQLNDRGMMGDGVIDLPSLARLVRSAGYDGLAEVEIFSHRWWREPAELVIETCLARAAHLFDEV